MKGSDDPQTEMLLKVGSKHLDVLLQNWSFGAEFYIVPAAVQLATDEHKKLIIDALRTKSRLIEVVVKKGWVKDAKRVLLEELRGAKSYLPQEWMEAVASLKDPAANKDLVGYFINGPNKSGAYAALRAVAGVDLDKVVVEAWAARNRVRAGAPPSSEGDLIPIALAHGVREALDLGFERLRMAKPDSYLTRRVKEEILAHTDAGGSDEEMLAWYEKRKKTLRWDASRRRYV